MTAEEIRLMSVGEIQQHVEDARQELFNLRFQTATRKLKNHARISEVRHDIARMKTVLREIELAAIYAPETLEEQSTLAPALK